MKEILKPSGAAAAKLVKRTKDLNKNVESIMGKAVKSETESEDILYWEFDIDKDLVMDLYDAGNKCVRVELSDYYNKDYFCMILDAKKLKRMADFLNKYLENK